MSLQDDTPLEDLPDQIITKYAGESQLGLYVRGTSALTVIKPIHVISQLVLVGVTLLIYDYLLTM